MCELRTNFQLNHAICLASRPKSRCFFSRYRPKSRCFFQDIERHQQIMKQYVHIFWHKKWRKKAHPIDHDFVTSDSVPFTEHLMFRVYFQTKGKQSQVKQLHQRAMNPTRHQCIISAAAADFSSVAEHQPQEEVAAAAAMQLVLPSRLRQFPE